MKIKQLALFFTQAFFALQLFSQTINGIIINADNQQPVPDANISIQNSTLGTVSDGNGFFSITTPQNIKPILLVSCVGFESQEIETSAIGNENLEINLQPVTVQLNKSIVVTASRNQLLSFQTPDAVSVLTQEELKNNAPRSMAEALIGTAGVWMQKTNHGGGSPFVRGFTGNQTLLLIDGIRLNNATFRYGPNQYFNTIDIFSVDQVEVIRGKGSVLYGSDALGGVINVITRTPDYSSGKSRFGGRGKVKYMNKGMEKSGIGELLFRTKNIALSGSVNYKDFGDIFGGGSLGYERPSGYDETGVNMKAKLRLSGNWQITSAYQYLIQNNVGRYDQVAQRGYQLYSFDPQIHRLAYAKVEHFSKNEWFRKIKLTVSNQHSDETRKKQKENSSTYTKENDVVKTNGISLENFSTFSKKWEAVTGAEFYSDNVESEQTDTNLENGEETESRGLYPNNSSMQNFAVFSQHTLKFDKFHLNMGGRFNTFRIHSVDDEFGEVTLKPSSLVGNISGQYFTTPEQQFMLSAHTAFRAPNINDISSFGQFDYGIEIPSTDLAPEKTFTLEGGYKKTSEWFSMALTVFNTRLRDQIVRVEATYNGSETINGERVYKKSNVAKSNISGVEFESGLKLSSQFSLINNLTWLYGKNLENDEPMRRIPPLNGKLALQYSKSKIFGEAEFLFAAKQDRLSGGDIDDHRIPDGGTPGWNILNLKAGYSWKNIAVNAGLQNVFNQAYRIHGSGVDGYGRSLWVTLQFEI
ncbi:TonB-dependent receptor [Maribellus comscasis]|uniref:TonB-dependent receptor n=1 Tax=Maribellus comscasis TaxID=2681766 RepID=A0A6I6JQV3_9BACT|nr:TonB-dependent receptor [Maribellus comscasis]QGY43430.1 TonB-dependent receptor [Maribellus comscasis]